MTLDTALVFIFALGALAGAVAMIFSRQPMRCAMALITSMIFLGGVYGLLGVHFVAAFQILIYVGAVMVFMVYAIMLLERKGDTVERFSVLLLPGAVVFVVLLGVIGASLMSPLPPAAIQADGQSFGISAFSVSFLSQYWLVFELTSVLLVAAVVGALAVIRVSRTSLLEKRNG